MSWEIADNYFADQLPMGLGRREAPPTGAYQVLCKKSEHRTGRGSKSGEKSIFPELVIQNDGEGKGMVCVGVKITPPKPGDPEGKRNVRDAIQRAAILAFNPQMADALTKLNNVTTRVHSGHFDGKTGYIWYERAEQEGDFPEYRFLTAEMYQSILDGGFKPARKNGSGVGPAAAVGAVSLGTPPASIGLPPNGAGGPVIPTAPATPDAASAGADLLG